MEETRQTSATSAHGVFAGRDPNRVVVAVLACPPCDEVAYSAVVPRRPELAQPCPGCGAAMAVADLIVGE